MNQDTKTTIVLPFPHRPQDVRNLGWVDWIEALGFRGPDVSLEISLFEYGVAWLERSGETIFIHQHPTLSGRFDRTEIKDRDPRVEFNWVDWECFLNCQGMNYGEWSREPFPGRIFSLVNHYGPENVFGTSYWEGFEIKPDGPDLAWEVGFASGLLDRKPGDYLADQHDVVTATLYCLDVARRALQEVRQFNEREES